MGLLLFGFDSCCLAWLLLVGWFGYGFGFGCLWGLVVCSLDYLDNAVCAWALSWLVCCSKFLFVALVGFVCC